MKFSKKTIYASCLIVGVIGGALIMLIILDQARHNHHQKKSSVPPELLGNLDIYVLAGQSNMIGRGQFSGVVKSECIFVFGNDYRWRELTEPLDSPFGQVDSISKDENAGIGPGRFFASSLYQKTNRPIGLIMVAK